MFLCCITYQSIYYLMFMVNFQGYSIFQAYLTIELFLHRPSWPKPFEFTKFFSITCDFMCPALQASCGEELKRSVRSGKQIISLSLYLQSPEQNSTRKRYSINGWSIFDPVHLLSWSTTAQGEQWARHVLSLFYRRKDTAQGH